jgi:hypothetical protein
MTGKSLPEHADVRVCVDTALAQLCDVITKRDLPHDIRSTLCGVAAVLAVVLAFLPKDQERTRVKKHRARTGTSS